MPRPRKLPVYLSADESDRLLAAARCERDRVIILVGLFAGLRVAELVGLRVERIDLARRQLLVFRGKGARDRIIPVASRLLGPLAAWVGPRTEGWLFPSPKRPDRPLTTRAVQ